MTARPDLFDPPPGGPYLLSHSVGALPKVARARLDELYLKPWAELGSDGWGRWLETTDRFREAVAGLLGAEARDICPQPNLSAGLFSILGGLKPEPGRDVLLASAHAFPTIGFAMERLSRLGYRLRLLAEDLDPADPQVWADAIESDVAAVVAMHVHSNTGLVSPVAEIARLARERGAFCIVDIAQSAGVLPINLREWGADAAIGSCVKWLCGGPGAGFLWVSPQRLSDIEPLDVGWFSHEDPFAFDIRDFRYARDARRFWGGTPSIAPYALAIAGVETIAAIGPAEVLSHNRLLFARVAEVSGRRIDMSARGGTLCLTPGARLEAVSAALTARGCRFDQRGGTLRLSLHIYNDEADAIAVGEALTL